LTIVEVNIRISRFYIYDIYRHIYIY